MASGGRSVFIVDDQSTIQKMLSDLLGCLGYNTIAASDGYEAIRIYRERQDQIELVLLDVVMPGMNGFSALEKLREINPLVKVIICSAYFKPEQLSEANKAQISGFLSKPYSITTLSEKMEEVLAAAAEQQDIAKNN
jgi:two-component system, cell cycle sensor histidine kinase and response regulator CckA